LDFNPDETTLDRYNEQMASNPHKNKLEKRASQEPRVTLDFAGDGVDPSEITEFDRAMRGIIQVPKEILDKALKKEKRRRATRRSQST